MKIKSILAKLDLTFKLVLFSFSVIWGVYQTVVTIHDQMILGEETAAEKPKEQSQVVSAGEKSARQPAQSDLERWLKESEYDQIVEESESGRSSAKTSRYWGNKIHREYPALAVLMGWGWLLIAFGYLGLQRWVRWLVA